MSRGASASWTITLDPQPTAGSKGTRSYPACGYLL